MKYTVLFLCATLFTTFGWAAHGQSTEHSEGDTISVSRSVSASDTLAFSGDTSKFRAFFEAGCPSLLTTLDPLPSPSYESTTSDGTQRITKTTLPANYVHCSFSPLTSAGTLTFTDSGTAKIGIISIDDNCVSGGAEERSSVTLTWVLNNVTTTDTYHFSDDDQRSKMWLMIFPDDTNAC